MVLCYDVASELSLHHVQHEWLAELLHAYGHPEKIPPVIMVGAKVDTRQSMEGHGVDVVLETEGAMAAIAMGECCHAWLEASAQTDEGVLELKSTILDLGCLCAPHDPGTPLRWLPLP